LKPGQYWTVPPNPLLPKSGDVTGDGRQDWNAGRRGIIIAPLGDVIVDSWIADNGPEGPDSGDSLIIVIGHDTNGNRKLEPGEVIAIIEECQKDPGVNNCEVVEYGGIIWIVHENWSDSNGNDFRDPGESSLVYKYNHVTGELWIYVDGILVHRGTPDGNHNTLSGGSPFNWWYK
jgi:hypothetical protein